MIQTKRLFLRDFVTEDWPAVHAYGVDPEVFRFQHWGPNTEHDSREFVQLAIRQQSETPRKSFELAIVERQGHRLIGAVGIRIKSTLNRDADMGYSLRRDCWGKGYGTEAAQAILDYGFDTLGLHRIWATAAPENQASIRVLEKIGMKHEGILRQNIRVRGAWRDSTLFAILEGDRN